MFVFEKDWKFFLQFRRHIDAIFLPPFPNNLEKLRSQSGKKKKNEMENLIFAKFSKLLNFWEVLVLFTNLEKMDTIPRLLNLGIKDFDVFVDF